MTSRISIIADDLGYCQQRSKGIFELHSNGLITAASILANGSSATEDAWKANSLNIPLRLHLNLTEGKPLSPAQEISSLVGDNGLFLGKLGLRRKLAAGAIVPNHVEKECKLQIAWYSSMLGMRLQALDGHQHVHVLPMIRDVIAKLLKGKGIETRIPLQENIASSTWIDHRRLEFYKSVNKHAEESKEIFNYANIRFIPHFIGLSTMGKDMTIEHFEKGLLDLQQKHSIDFKNDNIHLEFMVHPGFKSINGQGGCGEGPDDFSMSQEREHEMAFLQCKDFHNLLDKYQLKIKVGEND